MAPHRRLPFLLFAAVAGCSLPAFEIPTVGSRLALVPTQAVDTPREEAQRFAIRPDGSLLEILGNDLPTGPHTLTFTRFRGSLVPEEPGGTGTLTLDVDLRSLRTDTESVASIVKDELFEVDRYPHATIRATLRPGSAATERKVEGNVLLHGVRRGLRFSATLRHRRDRWYLSGDFVMSRVAHDMRRTPELDWLTADEFLVKLDLLATPERVTVEMGGGP
jgi:polyisoprenoid-binding protein YceI